MARSRTSKASTIEPLEGRQLLAGAPTASGDVSTSPRRVVGYFPDYRFSYLNKIDFTALTHINYFSVSATTAGALTTSGVNLSNLATTRNKAHAAGVTISITVGPQTFGTMAGNATARAAFVTNIIQYATTNGLDGIDIDWEPPATGADKTSYGALIDALYAQAHPLGLLLSAAVNPITTEIPVAQANKLDWINIMGYDFQPANHSTYTDSVNSLVRWSNYGVAKDKLVLGVPFYGKTGDTWATSTSRLYGTLVNDYLTANGTLPPASLDFYNGYYFNGPTTMAAKSQYVIGNNYGGVMIWELGEDSWTSSNVYNAASLLPVIKNVIQPVQTGTLNIASISPASGTTARATVAKPIAVNVTARLGTSGVMQVDLVRDGAIVSQAYQVVSAASPTYANTFNLSITEPSPGTRSYTVVARFRPGATAGPLVFASGTDMTTSVPFSIVWQPAPDLIPPTVTDKSFQFETSQSVRIVFSESVAGTVAASDLLIKRIGSIASTTASSYTYDAATNSATFTLPPGLADGDYRATLAAGSVADIDGNLLASDQTVDFFLLAGDVNRDRSVNFADLVILAQNYGQSERTYSQGNLDYSFNGNVDFNDLVMLAQHYNTTLPVAITMPPPALVTTTGGKSRRVIADLTL